MWRIKTNRVKGYLFCTENFSVVPKKKPCFPSRRESGYLSPGPTSNFLENLKSDLVREYVRYQDIFLIFYCLG